SIRASSPAVTPSTASPIRRIACRPRSSVCAPVATRAGRSATRSSLPFRACCAASSCHARRVPARRGDPERTAAPPVDKGHRLPVEELGDQPVEFIRLLPLWPVTGAIDQPEIAVTEQAGDPLALGHRAGRVVAGPHHAGRRPYRAQ